MSELGHQVIWLFILAIPVACISWTVTHEEIFSEPREYFKRRSIGDKHLFTRKFFYMLTCEYCFSFYVTIFFLVISQFHLLFPDWRGYLISQFAMMWVANIYMNLFFFIRIDIKKKGAEAKVEEKELKK